MKSVKDLGDLQDKRVVIRCDFNVPLDGQTITDDGRIKAAIPTLQELRDGGAKVTVLAHLGRPKGTPDKKYSLAPVAKRLGELMGIEVKLAEDVVGESAKATVASLKPGDICLVENVRFEAGETSKDDQEREALAKQYAEFGDYYVSNGFGVVHRKQASVYDIAKLLPSAAGHIVKKEVDVLDKMVSDPERPFVVVLGGAKVADKIGVIDNLLKVADTLIIGGGMSYTFAKARGLEIGKSLLDESKMDACLGYIEEAKKLGKKLLLPIDVRVAEGVNWDDLSLIGEVSVVPVNQIPADKEGLDIGPETEKLFAEAIAGAKSVFWNGPMGVSEVAELSSGTLSIAKAMSETDGMTVVGGGDSAAAVRKLGFEDKFGHISTGGGASLEFMEGKELPGLAVLEEN